MNKQDVYIAGIDLFTSIGADRESSWDALCRGVSGIRHVDRFATDFIPTKIAACVDSFPGLDCEQRGSEMAQRVATGALQQAGVPQEARAEMGLYCALGMPVMNWWDLLGLTRAADREQKCRNMSAVVLKNECASRMGHALTRHVGTSCLPVMVNTACASGATAISLAFESVRRGDEELALVVGSDSSVHEEVLIRFSLLAVMSTANDVPARAMKPFSKARDGFVVGEGAAALLLASERAIRQWGLTPIARLSGVGDSTDNFHRTRSNPDGKTIIDSMLDALRDANLGPGDIDYVNAHGTSTVENDKMESFGINEVFGEETPRLWVTSNKSMIGHMLIAAGTVEAALSVMSITKSVVPPTINYDPDETLGVSVPTEPVKMPIRHVLSNSFGFGGQNVSLILSAV